MDWPMAVLTPGPEEWPEGSSSQLDTQAGVSLIGEVELRVGREGGFAGSR